MTFIESHVLIGVIALIILSLVTVVMVVKHIADTYFYKQMKKLERKNEELEEENLKFRLHDTRNWLALENAFYSVSAENRELRAELSEARKENETLKAELDEARKSARKAWRIFYGVKK